MDVTLSPHWIIILGALGILLYISIAGYRAVIATDIVQLIVIFIIFFTGVILVVWHCIKYRVDISVLPASYWNPIAEPQLASTFVWLAVFTLPTLVLRIDHWQRITTALDDKTAFKGYVISGIVLMAVFIILLSIGFANRLNGNAEPFYLYKTYLLGSGGFGGQVLYGLTLSGFLLVVVSSADTVLNSGSTAITQSLGAWRLIKTTNAIPLIIVSCIFTIIAIALALTWNDVVIFVTEGFKVMTVLLPAIISAILLKKPSSLAAFVSVTGGTVSWLLVKLLWQTQGHWSFIIGFAVSTITMTAVYKVDKYWNK
jgi:SSS family solute:Na+ symporter